MRALKYILIGILILFLVFLSFGLFNKSISYGSRIEVNKPIEAVWAVSQDASQYDQWLAGFQSMEHLSGDYMKPGSTYKIIVVPQEGAKPFEMIETLNAIKTNDHVDMSFASEMMDFEQVMKFKETDSGTVITTESEVIGKGIMNRAMFAMMEVLGGSFTKQEQANMDALKALIEKS